MNHCNDFAPCGLSIGQYNSYSYMGTKTINKGKRDEIIKKY